ncbi:MAG: hypothetical protein IPK55_11495 [Streptococcus sp.]|nr:hypothetical protein [Streptococcus sp.]
MSAAIVDEIVEDSASKNLDEIRMGILGKIIAPIKSKEENLSKCFLSHI